MSDTLKSGFNRDCFDRFGDDLCEELLKYLSFAERIKYECVCMQWSKKIYNRQHVLEIKNLFIDTNDDTLDSDRLLSYYGEKIPELKETSVIEHLIQKCKNINHIIIGDNLTNPNTISYDKLLSIIADNCCNLLSLEYYEYQTNFTKNMWQYFGAKCGQTLRSITFQPWDQEFKSENLLPFCPNVICLNDVKLSQLIGENDDEVLVPKLSEIKVFYEPESNTNDLMNTFVKRYVNTVKVFNITTNINGSDLNVFIEYLSQLIHLEKLSHVIRDANITDFVRSFEKLSINCKKMKHLTLELDQSTEMTTHSTYTQLLKCINNFSKLEYLHLRIAEEDVNLEAFNSLEKFSVKLLKNCAELKYLEIKANFINDNFVCDIENYLPNLKVISINTTTSLSDETMNFLSQSKQLKCVTIDNNGSTITDTGVSCLIDNCAQVKSLNFRWCKITKDCIDKLIEIAKQRKKVQFTVKFTNNYISNQDLIVHTDDVNVLIPTNLVIKFENFEDYEMDDFYGQDIDDMYDDVDDYDIFDDMLDDCDDYGDYDDEYDFNNGF